MSPKNKSSVKGRDRSKKNTAIRILPMSMTEEFVNQDIHDIQQNYFLNELKENRRGHYDYRAKGMNADAGDIVLFQIDNQIIASAEFVDTFIHKFPQDGLYKGAIIFDPDSIRIFEPITVNELRGLDTGFKGFSQAKQFLDIDYETITDLIDRKVNEHESDYSEVLKLDNASPEILHIHKHCFDFLDSYTVDGEKLLFLPRKKDTKFQKREDGYYFIGNKEYLQITFWKGDDSLEKIHNISFMILSNGTSYIEISSRDDESKAERLRALVDYLTEHTRLKFNEIKADKWNAKFEGDDYLGNLGTFIENEKKIIDGFIVSECNSHVELLYEGNCKKYIEAIKNIEEKYSDSNPQGVHKKPVGSFNISKSDYQMSLLHNEIQNSLRDVLKRSERYKSVELELDHVDITAFRKDGKLDFYELKIGKAKSAIRQALGQILEYNHYPCQKKADQMFIVSNERPTEADVEYLNHLRAVYGMNLYYRYFNVVDNELSESY